MSILTVLGYLIGRRKAILRIASTPGATWLGIVFVLSAGFAREYDGEDLLAEPWHVLLPLGVSLILSAALFCLIMPSARLRGVSEGTFLGNYGIFLRLFWMTAPLAWIYAIPVERFLSPGDATRANLWMLAIVSLWRVVLMARVVSVLFDAGFASAWMLLMLFADTVALVALYFAPLPVFSAMGGIRLTESESAIQSTAFLVGFLGGISWPIWLIGTLLVLSLRRPKWHLAVSQDASKGIVSRGLWLVAACSVLVWCFVLPHTQPEQQLRRTVETGLRRGDVPAAVALMSTHERRDFPPHWAPPPRIGYAERTPPLLDVLEAVCSADSPPWVRVLFLDKLTSQLQDYVPGAFWAPFSCQEIDRYLAVMETLPEGTGIVRDHPEPFESLLDREDCSSLQRERVEALLAAVGHKVETSQDGADEPTAISRPGRAARGGGGR